MRKTTLLILALIIASCASASAITKVAKTDHTGFYIGFGLGYGNLGLNFDNSNLSTDRQGSGAGVFFIGGALRRDLLLGLDANVWTKQQDNVTSSISTTVACLTYYPSPKFFIKGGIGFASADVEVGGFFYNQKYSETGFGAMLGAGMEFRLMRKFALVPSAQWSFQNFDHFQSNVFSMTFNIGWFW